MKVILTKDVQGLGRSGDVKEVSEGHARNFLLPRKLALPATTVALERVQKEQQEKQAKVSKEHERASMLKHKLEAKKFSFKAKASGKNLFAAVSPKQIAEELTKSGIEISPNDINIKKPIKSLGSHEVLVGLAFDVEALLNLEVTAQ